MTVGTNPFGDGRAARRIVLAVERWSCGARPLLAPDEQFAADRRWPLDERLGRDSAMLIGVKALLIVVTVIFFVSGIDDTFIDLVFLIRASIDVCSCSRIIRP